MSDKDWNFLAGKWNYKTQDYDEYDLPENSCVYTPDMDKVINCACCGNTLTYGSSYTSKEIHTQQGFGFGVCSDCYQSEMKRYQENRK